MINTLQYVELREANISKSVLKKFDCGHPGFNDYLVYDATKCSDNGEGVTYVLVSKKQYEENAITSIFAFATIQTMALYFNEEDKILSLSAAEIKYFAISKYFQKASAYRLNLDKCYSTLFFENLLMELYEMSIKTIGFLAIFLRANQNGEKLYRRKHFIDADKYVIPYSEDDPLGECKPLVLIIKDNMYSIFGVE